MSTGRSAVNVQSLVRAGSILDTFTQRKAELSLKEITEATGLSKSTCYRLLATLENMRFIDRTPDRARYRIGIKLFELGLIAQNRMNLRRQALPYLVELAETTEETAFLITRDRDEALCIERVEGTYPVKVLALNVGGRLPLHLGGAQRALLAELPDAEVLRIVEEQGMPKFTETSVTDPQDLLQELQHTRATGYGRSWEDITPGVAAVGAIIKDHTGEGVAAVSIAGIIQRFNAKRYDSLVQQVKEAAFNISQQMSYNPHGESTEPLISSALHRTSGRKESIIHDHI